MEQQEKPVIRLKRKELMKAAIDRGLEKDITLAQHLGISKSLLYYVKLPEDNPKHMVPGSKFIAAVLSYFDEPFEKFFFLDQSDTSSQRKEG